MMIPRGNSLFSITFSEDFAPLNPRLIKEDAHPGNLYIATTPPRFPDHSILFRQENSLCSRSVERSDTYGEPYKQQLFPGGNLQSRYP